MEAQLSVTLHIQIVSPVCICMGKSIRIQRVNNVLEAKLEFQKVTPVVVILTFHLSPSINRLVNDRNTKI